MFVLQHGAAAATRCTDQHQLLPATISGLVSHLLLSYHSAPVTHVRAGQPAMRYAAGAFFGELALLRPASKGRRAFTVKATAPSRCLRLTRRRYCQLCPAYAGALSSPARPTDRPPDRGARAAAAAAAAARPGAVVQLRHSIATGSLSAAAVAAAAEGGAWTAYESDAEAAVERAMAAKVGGIATLLL